MDRKIILVTSLDDSGPGTLREALGVEGPRLIIPTVSGTIWLESMLVCRNGDFILDGSVAGNSGICVAGPDKLTDGGAIQIRCSDVVLRYIRVRAGATGMKWVNSIHVVEGDNIWIDHCSVSWGPKGNVGVWGDVGYIRVSDCIISEGLDIPIRNKPLPHSKGALFGGGVRDVVVERCLFAHNRQRNPLVKADDNNLDRENKCTVAANVIYNWIFAAIVIGSKSNGRTQANVTNNVFIPGYDTYNNEKGYPENNLLVYPATNHEECLAVYSDTDQLSSVLSDGEPFRNRAPIPDHREVWVPENVKDYVLANAGATLPRRDAVDERIVADVLNETGRVIQNPLDVGGWPDLV